VVDSRVEEMDTFFLRVHLLFLQAADGDEATLFFTNLKLLEGFARDLIANHACRVQKVVELLVIELKEGDLDVELRVLGLRLAELDLIEDELEDPGNNTNFFERHADRATRTHRMSLS